MKKIFVISMLLGLSFLVSCGKDEPSNCESYINYMECTYKKSNLDKETIQKSLDSLKSSLTDEKVCKTAIDTAKQVPLVEGCSL